MRLAHNGPPAGYTISGKPKHGKQIGTYHGFTIWCAGDAYMLTHPASRCSMGPFFSAGAAWRHIIKYDGYLNSREV